MSAISNQHDIVSYNGTQQPATGNRLVTITYKTDKATGVKKASMCASIPVVTVADIQANSVALLPALQNVVEKLQDAMVRDAHEAGKKYISTEALNMASVIEYMNENGSTGRMSKEFLLGWFDSSLSDVLTVAVADKLGISNTPTAEETHKVTSIVNAYRDSVASLAMGTVRFSEAKGIQLLKALELCDSEDVTASKLVQKVQAVIAKPDVELLSL